MPLVPLAVLLAGMEDSKDDRRKVLKRKYLWLMVCHSQLQIDVEGSWDPSFALTGIENNGHLKQLHVHAGLVAFGGSSQKHSETHTGAEYNPRAVHTLHGGRGL